MAKLLINNDQAPNEAENQSAQAPQAPVTQMPGTPSLRHYYAASQTIGGREVGGFKLGGRTYSKVVGAKVSGANMAEADMNALKQFDKLSPSQQLQWGIENGAPPKMIEAHKATMPQAPALPPSVLAMPNQPDRAGPKPGVNVDQRFAAMGAADASRNAAVKRAVTAAHAAQVKNPEGTIDAAIAVHDAALAKDGITDLGGGNKAMKNKYGSGFAVPMPEGPRQPGVIRDEKGTVDVGKMMKNKGGNGPVPYVAPTPGTPFANSPTAGEMRPETQQQIATGIANLMPGADKRRQKDAEREVEVFRDNNAFQYGSGIFDRVNNYLESGGFTTGNQTPPAAIAKTPTQQAKPEVIQAGRLRVPTLAEAMNPPKQTGPLPHVPQDFKAVKDIPATQTVAGYNVAPSFTAEEAKQADAKKQQGAKDLDSARVEQWNNHLKQIQDYAGSIGASPKTLTTTTAPGGLPTDAAGIDWSESPHLSRLHSNFKPAGVAFKQHGTGREVKWSELIQDYLNRAKPHA